MKIALLPLTRFISVRNFIFSFLKLTFSLVDVLFVVENLISLASEIYVFLVKWFYESFEKFSLQMMLIIKMQEENFSQFQLLSSLSESNCIFKIILMLIQVENCMSKQISCSHPSHMKTFYDIYDHLPSQQ